MESNSFQLQSKPATHGLPGFMALAGMLRLDSVSH